MIKRFHVDDDSSLTITRFIADSNGNVEKELWNEGTKHKHVKYYYQDGDECKWHFQSSTLYEEISAETKRHNIHVIDLNRFIYPVNLTMSKILNLKSG